jgi:hypothetical protein
MLLARRLRGHAVEQPDEELAQLLASEFADSILRHVERVRR